MNSARKQLDILQKEISEETTAWFGASWDSEKTEYITDKDGLNVTALITDKNEKLTTYYLVRVTNA